MVSIRSFEKANSELTDANCSTRGAIGVIHNLLLPELTVCELKKAAAGSVAQNDRYIA
jgi:hypothetical protein